MCDLPINQRLFQGRTHECAPTEKLWQTNINTVGNKRIFQTKPVYSTKTPHSKLHTKKVRCCLFTIWGFYMNEKNNNNQSQGGIAPQKAVVKLFVIAMLTLFPLYLCITFSGSFPFWASATDFSVFATTNIRFFSLWPESPWSPRSCFLLPKAHRKNKTNA